MYFSTQTVLTILLILVVALVAYAIGHSVGALRTRRSIDSQSSSELAKVTSERESSGTSSDKQPRFAVVYNPTKPEAQEIIAAAQTEARNSRWAQPLIIPSDEEDGGVAAARKAVDEGVDLIIAAGGDGTVRAVAHVIADTDVALGLVPIGTGNLLARNTGLFFENPEWSIKIAMYGHDRHIDVIRTRTSPQAEPDTSVVMTGMGYDAAVMETVSPELKERIGWLAYVEAGSRQLTGNRTKVKMKFDDKPVRSYSIRSVLGANAGRVQAGLELLPGSRPDDGLINVLVTTPKNIAQWASVLLAVVGRRKRGLATEIVTCSSVTIEAEEELALQLDGDFAGMSDYFEMRVVHAALTLRTPTPNQRRQMRSAQWNLPG